jgi:hypothetical protein
MRDLANERDVVVRRLATLNVEAVNAESWSPTGATSWDKIREEIESSDIFLLLLGERYGWIPTSGPGSDTGVSVTQLEYEFARKHGLPVLPFLKRLEYDAPRDTPDAIKRDAFRSTVTSWVDGRFVSTFDLASDLADRVAQAVVGMLTDEYFRRTISKRRSHAAQYAAPLEEHVSSDRSPEINTSLPPDLVDDIRRGRAVLFAGSGMSLSAGMPSAAAFVEHFRRLLGRVPSDGAYGLPATEFASAAADVEALLGRFSLLAEVLKLLTPPQGVSPSVAHEIATTAFDKIITTNFDLLFETVVGDTSDWHIINGEVPTSIQGRAIVKLHGSLNAPRGLVLTETDLATLDKTKERLWAALIELLATRTVVVVGSSLRDPSVVRLFQSVPGGVKGYVVLASSDLANDLRLEQWNLRVLHTTADAFFRQLDTVLRAQPDG